MGLTVNKYIVMIKTPYHPRSKKPACMLAFQSDKYGEAYNLSHGMLMSLQKIYCYGISLGQLPPR